MKQIQRLISGVMAFCLMLTMLPVQVFAQEVPTEETTAVTAETEATQASEETTVPATEAATEPAATEAPAETEPAVTEAPAESQPAPTEATIPAETAATEPAEPEETLPDVTAETVVVAEEAMAATSGTCGNNLTWTLDDEGVLTISGTGSMYNYYADYNFPPWFDERSQIKQAVIEKGVSSIGVCAFRYCENLTSITIPSTVRFAGSGAFEGCQKLKDVYISDVQSWCNLNFDGYCSRPNIYATRLYINGELVSFLMIPNTVSNLQTGTFRNFTNLRAVYIPAVVRTIDTDYYANSTPFWGCSSSLRLYCESANALSGWENHWDAYGYDRSLRTEFGFPAEQFRFFAELSSTAETVVIPDTITQIPAYAIPASVKQITIPESVVNINESAFANCGQDLQITYAGTMEQWKRKASNRPAICSDGTCPAPLAYGSSNTTRWILDNKNVLYVGGIGNAGSTYSTGNPPWNSYKEHIVKAVIGEGITSLGFNPFKEYPNLKSIELPSTLNKIESFSFHLCRALEEVHISDLKAWCNLPFQYYGDNPLSNGADLYLNGKRVTELMIPEGFTSVKKFVFYGCTSITELVIPEGVTSIGESAFYNCDNLKTVTLPTTLKRIEKSAFYSSGLQNMDLPKGLTSINESAFSYTDLETVTFPRSVQVISANAFKYCSNLKTIIFRHGANDMLMIGQDAFYMYNNLKTTVKVPAEKTAHSAVKDYDWADSSRIVTWESHYCMGDHIVISEGSTPPTCTQPGFAAKQWCEVCGKILSENTVIPATGHTEVIDSPAVAPTCTENGCTVQSHCSVCEEILSERKVVPALGHVEAVDAYIAPTCTETGLTEGSHCSVCGQILTEQKTIPVIEHTVIASGDTIVCTYCGLEMYARITQDYLVLDLDTLTEAQIDCDVSHESLAEYIDWYVEGDKNVLSVDDRGTVTAQGVGTAYVAATLTYGNLKTTSRCRVDVAETAMEEPEHTEKIKLDGVSASTTKLTTELFSTNYAEFDLLLQLPQNYPTTAMSADGKAAPEHKGVAIEKIKFTASTTAVAFDLMAKDDRTVMIVPTEYALSYPNELAKSYSSTITVTVDGKDYITEEALTLTVKKTLPKLKATVPAFNSFYAGQSQEITVTGATVTNITCGENLPNWLTLEGTSLKLTGNVPAMASAKLDLQIATEEWATSAAVSLSVKNTFKAPTLKLSASSVTLNPKIGDTAKITVTANPADFEIEELNLRLEDSKKNKVNSDILNITQNKGEIIITTTGTTPAGATYKLYVGLTGGKEVAVTIKTVDKTPTMTLKAKGDMDLTLPDQKTVVTPTFKNYSGDFEIAGMTAIDSKKADATKQFQAEISGKEIHISCAENTPEGSYTLTLKLKLDENTILENTVKVKVKRTAVKLKLSASKLTLNKSIDDKATVTVTSATKGYTLGTPVHKVMDKSGKIAATNRLTVDYDEGMLTVSTNEATEYGATYKVLVSAYEGAPAQTLTVTIPAEAKSTISSTLKVSGGIDVIRDGSSVTVTPQYKNAMRAPDQDMEKLVFYKVNGKTLEKVELFDYTDNKQGGYTVTKNPDVALDHSAKYKVEVVATFGNQTVTSNQANLTVKMGSTKMTLTAQDTILFANDKNSRADFAVTTADKALNDIAEIEIKDAKYVDLFQIFDYGNGEFAIGYKGGKVPTSLIGKTITINLNIFLTGNQTAKANAAVKLKLQILK